ncbi:MAG: hypothetical protein BM556_14215 [Bacteriovorax sp. MedPE-SWde]|nr:MAG: hypothetical protein BM556_14215 [Bacteriovorax sp. MedPE-SWde]
MEVYFLAAVLALAIGGGVIYSFLNMVDKEDGFNKGSHIDLLPHEKDFSHRDAELEEEKHSA